MTQVQILAIPGSLRAGSWNAALLRLAQERAPGGRPRRHLGRAAPRAALLGGPRGRVGPGAVEELRSAIAAADALLVATPEYNGGAPGQLKNALDWASRPYGLAPSSASPPA